MTKEDLVEGILDTLDDLPLEALRALADGLKGVDGALGLFYLPIYYTPPTASVESSAASWRRGRCQSP